MFSAATAAVHSRNHQKGFTLIELMVVLAIIAILAAIAVGTIANSAPRSRTVELAYSVRSALAEGRMRAMRTGRMHKVCIFKDPIPGNVSDDTLGRVLVFGCNGRGSDCGTARLCQDTPDTTAMDADVTTRLFANALMNSPATRFDRTCTAALNTLWCPIALDAFQVDRRQGAAVASFGAPVAGASAIEVTYGPNGLVLGGASSAQATSVRLVNAAYCTAGCSGATPSFSQVIDLSYTLGGVVRMNQ